MLFGVVAKILLIMQCIFARILIKARILSSIVKVFSVFAQHEVSSDEETSADDVRFPVSVTDSHMQPVVVLKKSDMTRYN